MVLAPPRGAPGPEGDTAAGGGEVVELGLLLHAGQVAALEAAAHRLGLTAGQVVRRLIRDFLRPDRGAPAPAGEDEEGPSPSVTLFCGGRPVSARSSAR
jgi:hypothetical protein